MSQKETEAADRWTIVDSSAHAIRWNIGEGASLPHKDDLEMSGQLVSVVVDYSVDANRRLRVNRRVYWPTLREKPKDVRGYLRHFFHDDSLPRVFDGELLRPPLTDAPVRSIQFDGIFQIEHEPERGLQLTRKLFPSMHCPAIVELCTLTNVSDDAVAISPLPAAQPKSSFLFLVGIGIDNVADVRLAAGESTTFGVIFYAVRNGNTLARIEPKAELQIRQDWQRGIKTSLVFESPDPVLNGMFALAKIRAAESVFRTKLGLVHSPGGQRYYGGIWANDQAEYSGPFFPFLGDPASNEAALNAYRVFAGETNRDYIPLPYSFEVEGDAPMQGADRGDAAMIAYGAARFALASGSAVIGQELWPLIEWCLEYCRRKLNHEGVVASDTDELEGRFPTGEANLSTSSLYYGALVGAAALAKALGTESEISEGYLDRAHSMRAAIAEYFHAKINGHETYQYYKGNQVLRSWICLPLAMGIMDRAESTIAALFSKSLWTADGLATQAGDKTFWDRATLYALRAVFAAGAPEIAMQFLQAYSRRRLLGDHVPYAVEAYPEGAQAHLSAESALYCRVITEGLFGIVPTGFKSFTCTPRLKPGWTKISLKNIRAFSQSFTLRVRRASAHLLIDVSLGDQIILSKLLPDGEPLSVVLP
jgi:hypothetical protein